MENIEIKKLTKQDYKNYLDKSISYTTYLENAENEAKIEPREGYLVYVPQNLQRMKRIAKTLRLNDEILLAVNSLKSEINWLVISEHWCGDASQTLPIFDAIAQISEGKISLRIVYRDANPALMDNHLTGQSRSIPKLIQFDKDLNITGTWGPRPVAAQKMVIDLKKEPSTASNYSEILHKWYADDKQQSIQKEILALLHEAS